ncbi:MAG: inositol monophosphatase [Pseudomonadota bacterium]|nr:inositol monophosphatase [Pseudomonadota bacterium]
MTGSVRSPLIHVMGKAVEKAGKSLLRDFGDVEHLQASRKAPLDFVSVADHKSEKILREELSRARPHFGFLMEESGEVKGQDPTLRWIIDPLDGTINFLHGLPQWCISVAAERNGEIIAGMVYDPLRDEMFWAEKGGGAWLNARRLRVSTRKDLADCIVMPDVPHADPEKLSRSMAELAAFAGKVSGIRYLRAAALVLCYVAAGRCDAYWQRGLEPWDVAAGSLIVTEAGGFVTEIDGGRDPIYGSSILATTPNLQVPVVRVLRGVTAGDIQKKA